MGILLKFWVLATYQTHDLPVLSLIPSAVFFSLWTASFAAQFLRWMSSCLSGAALGASAFGAVFEPFTKAHAESPLNDNR